MKNVKKNTIWCENSGKVKIIVDTKKRDNDIIVTFVFGDDITLQRQTQLWFISDFLFYHEFIA